MKLKSFENFLLYCILECCVNHKGLHCEHIVIHSITTSIEHKLLATEDFNKLNFICQKPWIY